uniref:Uncharacterized protein n=1 Tax=Rhizophora mucronata TaxID=61149 RepID=A0A2P2NR52_RHIMU
MIAYPSEVQKLGTTGTKFFGKIQALENKSQIKGSMQKFILKFIPQKFFKSSNAITK